MADVSTLLPAPSPSHSNLRGALWVLASALAFTLSTSLIKYLHQYSAPLQMFYAQVAGVLMILPTIVRAPRAAFVVKRMDILIGRSICSIFGIVLYYYSFQHLPLADAN